MDGGEQIGRRSFFLDSGATEEKEDEEEEGEEGEEEEEQQQVKKFPTFYVTRRFVQYRVRRSLPHVAKLNHIQSTSSNPISL
jgi:hypothetical protein